MRYLHYQNSKEKWIVAIFAMLFVPVVFSQTVDQLVLLGRAALTQKDIVKASSLFDQATVLSPSHQTANALAAGARFFSWPMQTQTQPMLDRLGFAITNRSIYNWTATPQKDKNGNIIPPNDFAVSDAFIFLRTNLLNSLSLSISNLDQVKDTNFILVLRTNEIYLGEVTVDYGDTLLLRSLLHFWKSVIYRCNDYDWNIPLNYIYNHLQSGDITIEQFLNTFPNILNNSSTNDLENAKQSFELAATQYLAASEIIRNRSTNVVRLFNFNPDMKDDEEHFRTTITEIRDSLYKLVPISLSQNSIRPISANIAAIFNPLISPRQLFQSLMEIYSCWALCPIAHWVA